MYKVFKVEGGWQIFWCPSAPMYYLDRVPQSDRVYEIRQAAYRRCKQLQEGKTREDKVILQKHAEKEQ